MELNIDRDYWDYAEKDVLRIKQTSATSTDGDATCSAYFGKVARSSSELAAAAEETLTITNTKVAAGDCVLASIIAYTGGTPGLLSAVTAANTITVNISNTHASDATTDYTVAFLVIKA